MSRRAARLRCATPSRVWVLIAGAQILAASLFASLAGAADGDSPVYLGLVVGRLQLHPDSLPGVPVQEIFQGSPADRAGMRPGDLLVRLNGRKIRSVPDLEDALETLRPGDVVPLAVRRVTVERPVKLTVKLARSPEQALEKLPLKPRPQLGIVFAVESGGQLVAERFSADSAAQAAGMKRGDRVATIAGHKTPDYRAILSVLAEQPEGQEVAVEVRRDGELKELKVRIRRVATRAR